MKIIITEDKYQELSDMTEKMLRYGGRIMTCLEELKGESAGERDDEDWDDDDEMGMRGAYGSRGGYGMRGGESTGYRRGVRGTGPYSRYRR